MVTTPSYLPAFHMFGSGFQVYLLDHFLRDQGEADQPVVPPPSSFFPFLKMGTILAFFQLSRSSLDHNSLSKVIEWLCNISHLLQHLWVHPIHFV